MGTNASLACGVGAWPPDFNDDNDANVFDLDILKPALFSTGPNPPYQTPTWTCHPITTSTSTTSTG